MLILTEKPNISKVFADALSCKWDGKCYSSPQYTVIHAQGHIFRLEEPDTYGSTLPIIPDIYLYKEQDDPRLAKLARFVVSMLKKNSREKILIATDADREGEIIARECLSQAGITDFSNCYRFWVSEALTPDVIKNGIQNAKPLTEYNKLALQGFARQHSDWLVGMNFSRLLSTSKKFTVGRVQTALLSAIDTRSNNIQNFVPKKYYVHNGIFQASRDASSKTIRGVYFQEKNEKIVTDFSEPLDKVLASLEGKSAQLINNKSEKHNTPPPSLYNLNDLQKEAFKKYGYKPDATLKILQGLYDDEKCISYPRTPSKVMGSGNVDLCKTIYHKLASSNKSEFITLANISLSNKRVFDDKKLESHHALIPLGPLPDKANEAEKRIYNMVLERFFLAFLPSEEFLKQTYILSVDKNQFKISGKKTIEPGWKKFIQSEKKEEEQSLDNVDWNNLILKKIEAKENWTKPPEYFNEGSIINFMENPKNEASEVIVDGKLHSIGTPATRHTFIPKLLKLEYLQLAGKSLITTEKGKELLKLVKNSPFKSLINIDETTCWEAELTSNPEVFEQKIKQFVKKSCIPSLTENIITCPLCKNVIRESDKNFYCTGYKQGCKFNSIWKNSFGTSFNWEDVLSLCKGQKTNEKNCKNKAGVKYKASFFLDKDKGFILTPLMSAKE